jgi:uncharacterized protein YbjT (DUF2867 family)
MPICVNVWSKYLSQEEVMNNDQNKTLAPILVTGATGQHGGTGAYVVEALRKAGRSVRVLARKHSAQTKILKDLGAEIILGDFHDRQSLLPAFDGVSTATFTYPINAGVVEAAAAFASVAREKGTSRIIVTSMGPAHPQSPSHLGRAQWLAEEILAWAGLDLCVLRIAALFFENIPILHAKSIREEGVIRNSFGEGKVPWISGLDAARLVVAGILHPERFGAGAIHYPPGAEYLSHAEMAETLGNALHRPLRFEAISKEAWTKELTALATENTGGLINADMAKHISAVGAALASSTKGPIVPPDRKKLASLVGSSPLTFQDFLARSKKEKREQASFPSLETDAMSGSIVLDL